MVPHGAVGSPKTKGSRRTLPMPKPLLEAFARLHKSAHSHEGLVFPTRTGSPQSDSNLLARYIKPAGKQLGMPWIS